MNSGELMKNSTQEKTTTSLFTVSRTLTLGVCDGRSVWMIDCRKFDDPDCDKSLRKHIGRNPRITKSFLESENHHALHSRLYDGMYWFFSSGNIVIMICRSGRHRSDANAELWSTTLTRCSRHQHSVSLLHLSELDFWENTCAGNCSECSKLYLRVFQTHYRPTQAECLRRVHDHDQNMQKVRRASSMRKTSFRKL